MFLLRCAMSTTRNATIDFAQQNLGGFAHSKKFSFITDVEITISRDKIQEIRVRFKVKTFFLMHRSNYSCSLKKVFGCLRFKRNTPCISSF